MGYICRFLCTVSFGSITGP